MRNKKVSSLYITVNLIEEVKRNVIEYERKKKG